MPGLSVSSEYDPERGRAVLLRRSLLERIGSAPTDMLLNGDWLTYARILLMSDIAFVSTPLNYFRQHRGPCEASCLKNHEGLARSEWSRISSLRITMTLT